MDYVIKAKPELEALQLALGQSVSHMATKIGVTRQTYARALKGEPVSPDFIAGCIKAFEIPMEQLFCIEEKQNNVA